MLQRAGNAVHGGGGSDVDRKHVVRQACTIIQHYDVALRVDGQCRSVVEVNPRIVAQAIEVDVAIAEGVMTGDESGQHAGIRRVAIRAHHDDLRFGRWCEAHLPDDLDVTVTAAEEKELLHGGLWWSVKGANSVRKPDNRAF